MFHIAEWYGHPFLDLSNEDRVRLAGHKVGRAALTKVEADRLVVLEEKAAAGPLAAREADRLDVLRGKLAEQQRREMPCPFRSGPFPVCNKPNGICSLMIYNDDDGEVRPIDGERGKIRALCPFRLHAAGDVFRQVGELLLDDPTPALVGEVGFLESVGSLDSDEGEDVGRIDMIMVKSNSPEGHPMEWCAAEVQAVYFSGAEMAIETRHILDTGGVLSMPQRKRRPDYRSSGVKRLMPQLQTKIPTLRRWGKKMAVIVDVPFFMSMGAMRDIDDQSNADIAWILVDFVRDEGAARFDAVIDRVIYTTLESAIEGLTGGVPVSKDEFERRIRTKLLL